MSHETYEPAFAPGKSPHPSPYISYGTPYSSACAHHVASTFHARRVFILASGALSRNTDHLPTLIAALEATIGPGAVVGVQKGVKPHTLYSDILTIVHSARAARADILVTLGGGSLTDAAKVTTLALANSASSLPDLESLYFDSPTLRTPLLPAVLPIICIPTSLSSGEYTPIAGATNDVTKHKHSFQHLTIGPRLIILSPHLSTTTPLPVWLSTGVRAIDHCVEAICSIASTPEADATATAALQKLVPGLLATQRDPDALDPRLRCQLGAKEAIACGCLLVPMGASHGIGHQLGPLGVGHGETSCVLMPAVMRFNKRVNAGKQATVLGVLKGEGSVRALLVGARRAGGVAPGGSVRGQDGPDGEEGDAEEDLAYVLDVIFRALGLPRSLKEVGVGRGELPLLAEGSLDDRWCKTNPVPLRESGQVMEILEMVVGDQ